MRKSFPYLTTQHFAIIALLFAVILCACSTPQYTQKADLPAHSGKFTPLEAFQNLSEMENVPLKVKGKIPSWLVGDFVRNGPGIVKDKCGFVKSWFDGLGKLYSFKMRQGGVFYTTKFIRSDIYCDFLRTGKFDFLGFAQKPETNRFSLIDFIFDVKNEDIINANVNIAKIKNTRVALTEIPLPVVFDKNLNTCGYFDYADHLTKNYSFESAHVLEDPDTKDTWNFLIEIGLLDTTYQIYKIPCNSRERQLVASIPVSSISYMHSFSFAGRYLVLIDYPLRAKNPKDLAYEFIDAFSWYKDQPTYIYLIDKRTGACRTFLAPPFFSFHHVNGFEKDGKVFIDLIAYPSIDIIEEVNYYPYIKDPKNTYVRLEIDPLKNTVQINPLSPDHMEFPRLNESFLGKPYQYFYAVNFHPKGDGIVKYDQKKQKSKEWAQEGLFANEPLFIPRPQAKTEDDGVVLSVINDLNKKTSFLMILDARSFKEIARVEAPHLIPFGFHGQFFRE
jgi:beta,beta-carotene 9',10'-dioxygenase